MSELGQQLRHAREEKGLSLDELQEITKIQKRYLAAIEEGQFNVLPGSFYVRAFIKSYAEAVGLDPADLLQSFRAAVPAGQPQQGVESIRRKRAGAKSGERLSRWATGIILWAFLLLVAGIIYFFVNRGYQADDHVSDNSTNRITDKSAAASPIPSAGAASPSAAESPSPSPTATPEPTVKLASNNNGVDVYAVKADKIKLEISLPNGECWLEVAALSKGGDGGITSAALVKPKVYPKGNTQSWEVDQSVSIKLGAGNAAEVKVNGVAVPTGDLPNVKRIQLDLTKA